MIAAAARKFLAAVREAGRIYRTYRPGQRRPAPVIEVSMDETDRPQTPIELLSFWPRVAEEGIPVQTIAPRFVGRFNKGVDYVGDVARVSSTIRAKIWPSSPLRSGNFLAGEPEAERAFRQRQVRPLPADARSPQKIRRRRASEDGRHHVAGGTDRPGHGRRRRLANRQGRVPGGVAAVRGVVAPYASVVDIDRPSLPSPEVVAGWDGEAFAAALRHDAACPAYSPDLRQLLHVGYKVAAEMGDRFTAALEQTRCGDCRQRYAQLYERHIRPLFLGQ